jgi:hypothetical protein
MNLTNYNTPDNKFLVFQSTGKPIEELPGILSGFLLALLHNYNFRIDGLDKSPFADVFTSEIRWWGDKWKNMSWKHGFMNLTDPSREEVSFLETQKISEKYFNSNILYFYTNKDLIPHIIKNESNSEVLKQITDGEKISYKKLYDVLFKDVEENYSENFKFLMDEMTSYKNQIVIMIDENVDLSSLKELSEYDFVYVLVDNQNLLGTIKDLYPNIKFSKIKQQKNVDIDNDKIHKIGKMLEFHFITKFPKFIDFSKNQNGVILDKIINQG